MFGEFFHQVECGKIFQIVSLNWNEADPSIPTWPGNEADPGPPMWPGNEADPGPPMWPGNEAAPGLPHVAWEQR